jgi:hypothetical protein
MAIEDNTMTPEQIQQAILISRQHDAYSHERDAILADIGQAYAAMQGATSRYNVLAQRVTTGDLPAVQEKHATMAVAMAGQDAVIQAMFTNNMAKLEEAQAIVFSITGGRFLPVVPLPEVEEAE